MSNNGYMDSFVADNRGSKEEYRDSGFSDESSDLEGASPGYNPKINSFNISKSSQMDKEKNKTSHKCSLFLTLNEWECIINILASTLGGGSFVFPYIVYEVGIITSLIIFIFVSVSVYYTLDLLRRFVVDSKFFSFSNIVQVTLGKLWQKIYAISAFLFYMSCIVNYLDLLFRYIKTMLAFLDKGWGKALFFIISCIIEILLCLFTKKLSKLHYLSLIVVIFFFIIILVLIIKSIMLFHSGEFITLSLFTIEDQTHSKKTNWSTFLFIMAKIIEFFYGYIYHSCFPTLLSGLDNITNDNTRKVQNISYLILVLIYFLISFFGCSFYDKDSDLIFEENINITNSVLNYIFKCLLVILFLVLIPIRFIVIRDNYTSLIGQELLDLKFEIIITSFCLLINNLIVFFIGDFKNFISHLIHYFGGALGVFICFVLPVISFIAINQKVKLRAIFGYIVVAIFIVIGFFSIFYNFQSADDGITN